MANLTGEITYLVSQAPLLQFSWFLLNACLLLFHCLFTVRLVRTNYQAIVSRLGSPAYNSMVAIVRDSLALTHEFMT